MPPLRYFASFFCLHHLRHEAAHRLCGFVLLLPRSVGVGAECESSVIVAEHTADGFDVHPILQCQRCEGVPQIVEPYLWQSCPRQYPEQHMQHAIWGDGVAVRRWEYILTSYFFLLRLENFYCISRDGDVAIKVFLLSAAPPPPSHLGGESLLDKSQAAPWHI